MRLTRPIPVLLTVRELNCGGIERDVTKIALSLDRTRFEPHVASYLAEGIRYEELRSADIPFLHMPVTSLKSLSVLTTAMRLRRYIREHGIRLVHAYDASAVFVAPIARVLRVPAVLSSVLGNRDLLDQRSRGAVRWMDKIVDAVVVNCEAMRRHMTDDERVPGGKIELCYNGVDITQFHPQAGRRPDPIADSPLVIGTVCVLRPEKAVDLLQEAFARVRHLEPGMKLLIVGSGPLLPNLRENAARLGIMDSTVFVPATPEVARWMRSMDIFVLPSHSEAFSNSLLEAMACGCSVVGSRVGGTPELVGSNDERGFLFKSGDAGDLAEKLSNLIKDANLRCNYAALAAKFAHENLSIEIAAERTAAIYEKVLQRKTGQRFQVETPRHSPAIGETRACQQEETAGRTL